MFKRIEVIISEDNKVQEALENAPKFEDCIIDCAHEAPTEYLKIDLLIIDRVLDISYLAHITKDIINLTNHPLRRDETALRKPFRLYNLLKDVADCRSNKQLFCMVGPSLLYNERASSIRHSGQDISLTDKENELMRAILLAKDWKITKEELLGNVWGYMSEAESSTIETYMSRLRAKLPGNLLLRSKDGSAQLSCLE